MLALSGEPGGLMGHNPGSFPEQERRLSYNDYLYTKPIEVRGGIRAGSKRGRLRVQLVGQAVAPDP